ncbi:hypothetical protein NDU88_001811 [Pleurodeles waltl]|uniref:Uncharacterized protein n=1 Tax=Pleurodeles waltl TaxID=8319 RepID=A0AAV7TJB0_PLEWA|nr:hypothetical protein NDU88_001811 [Pleurodeles waltl]
MGWSSTRCKVAQVEELRRQAETKDDSCAGIKVHKRDEHAQPVEGADLEAGEGRNVRELHNCWATHWGQRRLSCPWRLDQRIQTNMPGPTLTVRNDPPNIWDLVFHSTAV